MDWGWFEENKRQWWDWRLWCSNILIINYHVISTIWFQSGHCNLCLCKWSVVLELYVGCLHLPFSSNWFLSRTNLACQRSRICTCGNMVGLWTSRCRFTGHSWRQHFTSGAKDEGKLKFAKKAQTTPKGMSTSPYLAMPYLTLIPFPCD